MSVHGKHHNPAPLLHESVGTNQSQSLPLPYKSVGTYHRRKEAQEILWKGREQMIQTHQMKSLTEKKNRIPSARMMNIQIWMVMVTPNYTGGCKATTRKMAHPQKQCFWSSSREEIKDAVPRHTLRTQIPPYFSSLPPLSTFKRLHFFNKAFLNHEHSPLPWDWKLQGRCQGMPAMLSADRDLCMLGEAKQDTVGIWGEGWKSTPFYPKELDENRKCHSDLSW